MTDIFSLGCVFYFAIFDETILSDELGKDYQNIETRLKNEFEKTVEKAMSPDNSDQLMQIDLMVKMLKLDQYRPLVPEILQHPLFWEPSKSISFINAIRRKFDIMNPGFLNTMKNDYYEVLKEIQSKFNLSDPQFTSTHQIVLQQIQTKIRALDAKFEHNIKCDHELVMREIERKLENLESMFVEVNKLNYPKILQEVRDQIDSFGAIVINELTADQKEILKYMSMKFKSINVNVNESENPLKEVLDLIESFGTSVVGKLSTSQQDILKKIKKKLKSLDVKHEKISEQKVDDTIVLLDAHFLDDITNKYNEILKNIQQKYNDLDD